MSIFLMVKLIFQILGEFNVSFLNYYVIILLLLCFIILNCSTLGIQLFELILKFTLHNITFVILLINFYRQNGQLYYIT